MSDRITSPKSEWTFVCDSYFCDISAVGVNLGSQFPQVRTIARGISLHGNLHYGADSSYHGLWLCQMLQGWLVRIWCLFGPWDAFFLECCCVADSRDILVGWSFVSLVLEWCQPDIATNFTMIRSRIQPEIPFITGHIALSPESSAFEQFVCFTTTIWNLGTFDDCWTKFFSRVNLNFRKGCSCFE